MHSIYCHYKGYVGKDIGFEYIAYGVYVCVWIYTVYLLFQGLLNEILR